MRLVQYQCVTEANDMREQKCCITCAVLRCNQPKHPLIKTVLHSDTCGQKLHTASLILGNRHCALRTCTKYMKKFLTQNFKNQTDHAEYS